MKRQSTLIAAMIALAMSTGTMPAPKPPAKAPVRSPADVVRRKAKQAAKLAHHWYDLSTVIRDDFERKAVADAILYLDGRQLLRRKPDAPFLVQILPPLSNGALVPPTLAEALSA